MSFMNRVLDFVGGRRGRYLYSTATPNDIVVHDMNNLDERCNTDQIARQYRMRSDNLEALLTMPNAHQCGHCF